MCHPKGFGYCAVGNVEPLKYFREEIGRFRVALEKDPTGNTDEKKTKQEAGIPVRQLLQ